MPDIKSINGRFYDFDSKNNPSFLQTAAELKALGIKNYYFMLEIKDPRVLNIDPFKPKLTPDEIRIALEVENIETRLLWRPMHMQPIYQDAPYYGDNVAEELFNQGLCLPSGSSLTDEQINRVIEAIKKLF